MPQGLPQPFSVLVHALKPEGAFSEHARSPLRQTPDEAKAARLVLVETYDGSLWQFLDANGSIDVTQQRFLKDDLPTLIETSLLRPDLNDRQKTAGVLSDPGGRRAGLMNIRTCQVKTCR